MLIDVLKDYKIYLGSQSPRRKQLLEMMDIKFEALPHLETDENFPDNLKEYEIAEYLAQIKAQHYSSFLKNNNEIIITADTIVWINNIVLSKPKNYDEAFDMLKTLSGKMHTVFTGVCLKSLECIHTFSDKTDVYFKKLNDDEIHYYLSNYKPYDKAGSYGAQEWIGLIAIEKINGSYFNVMGLPVNKLYVELEKFIYNFPIKIFN
jgi:septum formation protein